MAKLNTAHKTPMQLASENDHKLIVKLARALAVEVQNCELHDPKGSDHHNHCRKLIEEAEAYGRV